MHIDSVGLQQLHACIHFERLRIIYTTPTSAQLMGHWKSCTELSLELQLGCKCLAKLPSLWHHVCEFNSLSIRVCDSKREHLPGKICKRVPVRTPVACQWCPVTRIGGLDFHGLDGASSRNVGHKHKVEVVMPIDGEAHPTSLHARNSTSKKLVFVFFQLGRGSSRK